MQTRNIEQTSRGRWEAVRFATIDSTVALFLAFFVNAAILITAAAAFYRQGALRRAVRTWACVRGLRLFVHFCAARLCSTRAGMFDVAEIQQAYVVLAPTLGSGASSTLFAVALLAAGQQSTLTGTMAGQARRLPCPAVAGRGKACANGGRRCAAAAGCHGGVFGNGKLLRPWQRRFATRMTAILPAAIVAGTMGIKGTSKLLNLSQVNLEIRFLTPWPHASRSHPLILSSPIPPQVILSMQLPFAIFPLVQFTSSPKFMGEFVLPVWQRILAWLIFFLVTGLNIKLVYDFCSGACWLCRASLALCRSLTRCFCQGIPRGQDSANHSSLLDRLL